MSEQRTNLLSNKETELNSEDIQAISSVLGKLINNFNNLNTPKKLSTINLVMKVAFTRDISKLVIPPLE